MFEIIEAALTRGDTAAALTAAHNAVEADPGDAGALHVLAMVQRRAGDFAAAAESLDRAIALAPDNARFQLARAVLALQAGERESAGRALEQALASDPNALAAYVLRGHDAVGNGDLERARIELRLAQRVAPEHPHVLALEGNLAVADGKGQEALRPLTRAIETAPEDDFVLVSLGLAFLAAGNPAFAEQSLRRALGRQPEARHVRWALIEALRRQDLVAETLAEVEALLARQPDDAAARALQGDLYLHAGDLDAALAAYRAVLAQSRSPGIPLSVMLGSLGRAGAIEAAEQLLAEQLRATPEQDGVWEAGLAIESQHPARLMSYAARWLEQLPDSAGALQARAVAAEVIGDLGAAEASADLALRLSPQRVEAQFIKLRAELRQAPEAALARGERLLSAATNLNATRSALIWKGFALDRLGRCEEAALAWLEARRLPTAARPLPEPNPPAPTPQPSDDGVPPRLLWGPPGSAVERVAATLQGIEGFSMLDDRFGRFPRQDGLGPERSDGAMATQAGWRLVAERSRVDVARALDWLLHYDARHAAQLPDARLLAVLADPRDLLLGWLAYGSRQEYYFPGAVEAAGWLAPALEPLAARLELARPGDLILRDTDLLDAAQSAERIAAFCDLPGQVAADRLARSATGLGGLPLGFAPGRWRAYAGALDEAFALLGPIAARLGYPASHRE
jgi:tetratricopeptide (TPR) repeat protein